MAPKKKDTRAACYYLLCRVGKYLWPKNGETVSGDQDRVICGESKVLCMYP